MRIKLDENLPRSAAQPLLDRGYDVDTVVDEGLAGKPDPQVVVAATSAERILFTLDRGLGDIRTYPPGSHAGIVVLRVDNQSPRAVRDAVTELTKVVALDNVVGCVGVWREGEFRLRRPRAGSGSDQDG